MDRQQPSIDLFSADGAKPSWGASDTFGALETAPDPDRDGGDGGTAGQPSASDTVGPTPRTVPDCIRGFAARAANPRGCGPIVLAFLGINAAAALIGTALLLATGTIGDMLSPQVPDGWRSEFVTYDDYDPGQADITRRAAEAQASTVLGSLSAPDSRARALIWENFTATFQQLLGRTVDELGLDASAYTDWALSDPAFTITGSYTLVDDRTQAGEGSVFIDADVADTARFASLFWDRAGAYITSQGLLDAALVPTDGQRAELQRMFDEAIDGSRSARRNVTALTMDLDCAQGSWQVTDEGYAAAVRQLFYPA